MQKFKAIFFVLILSMISVFIQAQGPRGESKFGETMRSNGRIYVVIAVILTILIGLILYLIRLEKKIGKMEKEDRIDNR